VDFCLWEPILDAGKAPDLAWLQRVVEFIDSQRRAGATTYIHCVAGVSRSGMVTTAYLMYRNRWGREKALAFVRSKRPQIDPNAAFMQLLREWEEVLKRTAARTDLSSGGSVVLKREKEVQTLAGATEVRYGDL
jgi:protein-tyrosine phosphatase